jgi:hypothetical protein
MDEKKVKTEQVAIDFGGGSCVAECDHCGFGLGKKKGVITDQQMELYRQVEDYAEGRQATLSFGLMDPIEEFKGDLNFLRKSDQIRLSTRDIRTYSSEGGVERVAALLGDGKNKAASLALSVHASASPARFMNARTLWPIIDFQIRIAEICEGSVEFGYRVNRSPEDPDQVFQSARRMVRRYVKAFTNLVPEMEARTSIRREGAMVSTWADVSLGTLRFSFGQRFFHSTYPKEDSEADLREQERLGLFVLALFPQEVHACHTTMNINDKTLRFSYPEMAGIIQEARERKVNASTILFDRIRERRANKRRSFALVAA